MTEIIRSQNGALMSLAKILPYIHADRKPVFKPIITLKITFTEKWINGTLIRRERET